MEKLWDPLDWVCNHQSLENWSYMGLEAPTNMVEPTRFCKVIRNGDNDSFKSLPFFCLTSIFLRFWTFTWKFRAEWSNFPSKFSTTKYWFFLQANYEWRKIQSFNVQRGVSKSMVHSIFLVSVWASPIFAWVSSWCLESNTKCHQHHNLLVNLDIPTLVEFPPPFLSHGLRKMRCFACSIWNRENFGRKVYK